MRALSSLEDGFALQHPEALQMHVADRSGDLLREQNLSLRLSAPSHIGACAPAIERRTEARKSRESSRA